MAMSWFLVVALISGGAPETVATGREVFLERCSMCHGVDGDGTGPLADGLPLPPRNFRGESLQWGNSLRSVEETVTRGRSGVMPSFEGVLSADEIRQVAAYVWSLVPPERQKRLAPPPVARAASRVFLVRQKARTFRPASLDARLGDTLVFINDDVVDHEVHALASTAPPIQSQRPRQWDRVVLDTTGTVTFGCAIHPAMRLTVKVTP